MTRARILARAGGRFTLLGKYLGGAKCEDCGVPDRKFVARACGWWMIPPSLWWFIPWKPDGMAGVEWIAPNGQSRGVGDNFSREICRQVYIVIAITHLNNRPGDDRDENLRARCQWCHLRADQGAHRNTRSIRKDKTRPLLAEARPISLEAHV